MTFVDAEGLTTSQADFMAALREMESPEAWLCFVNAGHTMADAKVLWDRGLIECSRQMGMPCARINTWIKHDGGDCPIDGEKRVQVRWKNPDEEGVTTHRAGAFNWKEVAEYRTIAPKGTDRLTEKETA